MSQMSPYLWWEAEISETESMVKMHMIRICHLWVLGSNFHWYGFCKHNHCLIEIAWCFYLIFLFIDSVVVSYIEIWETLIESTGSAIFGH